MNYSGAPFKQSRHNSGYARQVIVPLAETSNDMTDSEKKLLSVKRERARNFLPAIYNSVSVVTDSSKRGEGRYQSPSV